MKAAAGQEATVDNITILPQTDTRMTTPEQYGVLQVLFNIRVHSHQWCRRGEVLFVRETPKHVCGLDNIPTAYMVGQFSSTVKEKEKENVLFCHISDFHKLSCFCLFLPICLLLTSQSG